MNLRRGLIMGMVNNMEPKYTIQQIAGCNYNNGYVSDIAGEIDITVPVTRPWSLAYTKITKAKVTTTKNVSGWSLGERTFSFCHDLTDFVLIGENSSANGVATYAFWDCIALSRVRLVGNIKYIAANAFGNCKALTDIYVSFSEGEVANAPWGATNAVIHYNTVFDSNGNIID
jgi:hypothetical protein